MPEITLDARVRALGERLVRLEGMTEVVAAIRSDLAGIADGVDPHLAQHVAELDSRVERHALLIGRLLDVTPMAQPRDDET
jgi:hypothetical protein